MISKFALILLIFNNILIQSISSSCITDFFVHFAGTFWLSIIRMATGFSFIRGFRSQRGKNKLVSEGYIYKVDRVRGEKLHWVCHLPDCKGSYIQTAYELRTIHRNIVVMCSFRK